MAKTYKAIQTVTVGAGGQSSIDFTNIPQNYNDLHIKISGRAIGAGTEMRISFNGSSANEQDRILYYVGAGTVGSNAASTTIRLALQPSATQSGMFGYAEIYIPNYANTTTTKSMLLDTLSEENGTTYNSIYITGALLSSNSAISSISLTNVTGTFAQYSTATLYGVGGARATGGTITADGLYTYHTFTSSGTFVPLENIENSEVLVIAGGGGGGQASGYTGDCGGGGAGGFQIKSASFISANIYSAIVGAGGAIRTSGQDSYFLNISSTGGGFGGPEQDTGISGNGGNGGSGGGTGNRWTGGIPTAGQGIIGQGNNGGISDNDTHNGGAGGGGAGGVGGNTLGSTTGGLGGIGSLAASSYGLATNTGQLSSGIYYYSGGGGGGTRGATSASGGLGGGGAGARASVAATPGTANTGGGGGGASASAVAAAGGSGIIIIRYPNT